MAGTELQKVIEVSGIAIHGDAGKLVSLTDLWKANGAEPKKKPAEWLRGEAATDFVASLAKNLKVGIPTLSVTRRGRRGSGTWAHWQIALAYAKWLSPEFHQLVNAAFVEWAEEKRNPGLKIERGVAAYIKAGKSAKWVQARFEGIATRHQFTAALSDRNCTGSGIAAATREVAVAATGKTPGEFRAARGLAKSLPTRDAYSADELTWTTLAESDSADAIRASDATGDARCVGVVRESCEPIKAARRAYLAAKAQLAIA